MTIRCKFMCHGIADIEGSSAKKFFFHTQYDDTLPEDQRFTRWTPTGTLDVTIDNPAALAQLKVGGFYYLDLTPVG